MKIKNHLEYEKFWQDHWYNDGLFNVDLLDENKKKMYILDMFPYASGSGLHVGHVEGYTATDIYARFKKMQGYNVLVPMGFDAFGLPAEQYALETGNDPEDFTYKNIDNFKRQLKRLGKMVDWEKSFATCDKDYYKITQEIFLRLYENNLAELKEVDVNFCPMLGTVLANDEIYTKDNEMFSERGDYPVYKKPMKQWVLKITNYADKLLLGLDKLLWPNKIKDIQKNWIGKKTGANIIFDVDNSSLKVEVFTTRPDTIFGVSYLVVAPESMIVNDLIKDKFKKDCLDYIKKSSQMSSVERQINKTKTGVFTGSYAINPINGKKIPIWISDYVLADYAKGALMAVPAHDERDYLFAKKFNLEIIKIIDTPDDTLPYQGDGSHINSDFLNGLDNSSATNLVIKKLNELKKGEKTFTYKLRDWVFSRQRYWGEPFPIYFDNSGNIYKIPDDKLPLVLPKTKNIKPSGDGKSPLANIKTWLNFKIDGKDYHYDTNTMPQLAGSSWYYIAHLLKNKDGFIKLNSKKAYTILSKWLPVDLYIGGAEHAVGHLLYSRFWHKFMHEQGYFKCDEPFNKLYNQGMILIGGQKMSKSKGRVINPDEIINLYGADALRLYEMFMGPISQDKSWTDQGISASRKFIDRVINMFDFLTDTKDLAKLDVILNETIKKVKLDYENLQFNTAISQMMIFVNSVYKIKKISKEAARKFLILLNPICPHITEEINKEVLKNNKELFEESFPEENNLLLEKNECLVIFQVNGKLRGKKMIKINLEKDEVIKLAKEDPNTKLNLEGKEVLKIVYVPNKLVNFVCK